ncbi:MAG: 3-deoxy-D-manno-octulosonic acid transferase, partial [Alphaproteobacteria bacterium]|nr:3-deoxy-D-manno-octulosonic acid transferase [Alphaproteobacteria bacterium]
LITRLQETRPAIGILMTTGTVSSAALLEVRLPAGAVHQFVPVDLPGPVTRFLDHWRPDLALWLESELWPTLLDRTAARGVPIVLINGRLSAASVRNWRRARSVARAVLARFSLLLAQSDADAAHLGELAGAPVQNVGNLKRAAPPLPHDGAALAALRARVAGRPIWLAASTHDGEETIVAAAHARLAARHPGLLTVIAPRHPPRSPAIRAAIGAAGLRSAGDQPGDRGDLYIVDTLGELGLWYRLVEVAFVGGSLVPLGGHNPLEPARLGCAVLVGPAMAKQAEFTAGLIAAGAAETVADADALVGALDRLLGDPARRRAMGDAGRRYAAGGDEVVARVVTELTPYLAALSRR